MALTINWPSWNRNRRNAGENSATTQPVTDPNAANEQSAVNPNAGVLRAIKNMPMKVRALLDLDAAIAAGPADVTSDDEGLVYVLRDGIIFELRPWAKLFIIRNTAAAVDDDCYVSYEKGFRKADIQRLYGWWRMTVEGINTDWVTEFTEAITSPAALAAAAANTPVAGAPNPPSA